MNRLEVVERLAKGAVLRKTGGLSMQSKFDDGATVSHQVMQGLIYGEIVVASQSPGEGGIWTLSKVNNQ